MANQNQHSPSRPRPVPGSPRESEARSPPGESMSRAESTARLASPVPSSFAGGTPTIGQIPIPSQIQGDSDTPLAGASPHSFNRGPGRSALAAALEENYGRSPPRLGTPPVKVSSPPPPSSLSQTQDHGRHGSSGATPRHRNSEASIQPLEDPDVVRRHLVQSGGDSSRSARPSISFGPGKTIDEADGPDLDDFSSLQLQGGDTTREIYRWAEDAEAQAMHRGVHSKRSKSFHINRIEPEAASLRLPGALRRDYIQRTSSPTASASGYGRSSALEAHQDSNGQPRKLTSNFIEFLSLYGHFAGEQLEEEEESDGYFASRDDSEDEDQPGERSALLTPRTPRGRQRTKRPITTSGQNTPMGATLLLLKSFVGTGVLFLPRAFLNGGMLFSSMLLIGVAALSYYCFILLVNTRLKVDGSFGDMGGILYGRTMRYLILTSIVLSQVGFVAAYIVFTAENLQAFVVAVSHCLTRIDIKFMVLMQLVIFLPLSLIRDISKLGFTALIADAFILLGIIYLAYFDVYKLVDNGGMADIKLFNPSSWTLFIGTAIFTFEGIGLIIPIQESMKHPEKFPPVLAFVMVVITVIFTGMGALSYAAFGSVTKTVVLLNLPQDNKFVNAVQFLYSLAILLSTPLQLFPAIRILENEIFTRSGKYNAWIKWKKNIFRFFLVIACALIAWGGAGDLDKFVALVGSFACVPLVYVYPPLLHFKAVARTRWQRISDVVLCVFGFIVMAYTTVLTITSWASGAGGPKAPGFCDS